MPVPILFSLYLITGGLAAILPLRIINFDFSVVIAILTLSAQLARIFMVWLPAAFHLSSGVARNDVSYVISKIYRLNTWRILFLK